MGGGGGGVGCGVLMMLMGFMMNTMMKLVMKIEVINDELDGDVDVTQWKVLERFQEQTEAGDKRHARSAKRSRRSQSRT